MTVNACEQNNAQPDIEQASVSLVEMRADGMMTIHPALVQQFAPTLQALFNGTSPAPTLGNVTALPGHAGDAPANVPRAEKPTLNQFDLQRKESYRRGRIWASWSRRLLRQEGIKRYTALKHIADKTGQPVTDIRCLVEVHNKTLKVRAKAMRQNLVWQKHLHNLTDQQIADDLRIHPKTVASDRREVKQQQLRGMRNVR